MRDRAPKIIGVLLIIIGLAVLVFALSAELRRLPVLEWGRSKRDVTPPR